MVWPSFICFVGGPKLEIILQVFVFLSFCCLKCFEECSIHIAQYECCFIIIIIIVIFIIIIISAAGMSPVNI